jgi:hypothetical protein
MTSYVKKQKLYSVGALFSFSNGGGSVVVQRKYGQQFFVQVALPIDTVLACQTV